MLLIQKATSKEDERKKENENKKRLGTYRKHRKRNKII